MAAKREEISVANANRSQRRAATRFSPTDFPFSPFEHDGRDRCATSMNNKRHSLADHSDYPSPRNVKAFKYVKIPKYPFGVHSPTSKAIRKSPKFDDIVVKRKPTEPVDMPLAMAKYHRRHIPEEIKVSAGKNTA